MRDEEFGSGLEPTRRVRRMGHPGHRRECRGREIVGRFVISVKAVRVRECCGGGASRRTLLVCLSINVVFPVRLLEARTARRAVAPASIPYATNSDGQTTPELQVIDQIGGAPINVWSKV